MLPFGGIARRERAETPEPGKSVSRAVLALVAWFDSMRVPEGYGGPVAHWWQNCFLYTGAGLDWRYEGIVSGFLSLYRNTGSKPWLDRARKAADDLVAGQLPNGSYRNSAFELNPGTGGTPHEAACDLALLEFAGVLQGLEDPDSARYLLAAERNLRQYYVKQLWDPVAGIIRDNPYATSFVPNKAATLAEALLSLAHLTGNEELAIGYALPTLDAIVEHQVADGPMRGAIEQYSHNGRGSGRYFPFYVARCVPGLLAGYHWSGQARYLELACSGMEFVLRWRDEDGGFPQVVYENGNVSQHPRWVAGAGEILRALCLLSGHGFAAEMEPTLSWLLRRQGPTGAFPTAIGFDCQISQGEPDDLPEFRDLLPVCGWNDKPFRLLADMPAAELLGGPEEEARPLWVSVAHEAYCTLRGRVLLYREDHEAMELWDGNSLVYQWRKGEPWAHVWSRELLWK